VTAESQSELISLGDIREMRGDVRRWVSRAADSVSKFWNEDLGCFLRSNREEHSGSEDFFPTATYFCVPPLAESGHLDESIVERLVKRMEELHGQTLGGTPRHLASEIGSDADLGGSNSLTVGAYLEAVGSILEVASGGSRDSVRKWLEARGWLSDDLKRWSEMLMKQLHTKGCATLLGSAEHPYLTYRAVRALQQAERLGVGGDVKIPDRVVDRVDANMNRLLADHAAGAMLPGDVVALAFCASTLEILAPDEHVDVIWRAIEVAAEEQRGWAYGRTIASSKEGTGVTISPYEVGYAVTDCVIPSQRMLKEAWLPVAGRIVQNLSTLFASIKRTWQSAGDFSGWSIDYPFGEVVLQSWVTATVLSFLSRFERVLTARIEQESLSKLRPEYPGSGAGWLKWGELHEDPDLPFKTFLEDNLIRTIKDSRYGLPTKEKSNVSMILFGPPGTGKNTLVKALAGELGWPLIVLTPGSFIRDGLQLIESRASEIFSTLMDLDKVVVFFDECDPLFRKRPVGQTETALLAHFITSTMLPRLQDLHDRGGLVFIVATNDLSWLDPAMTRKGRIDHVLPIPPPGRKVREKRLQPLRDDHGFDRKSFDDVVRRTKGLSYKETQVLLKLLAGEKDPRKAYRGLIEQLRASSDIPSDALKPFADWVADKWPGWKVT